MAMVQPKSLKYRVWATHIAMWCFLALIMLPLLMVVAISFREGNYASGELIPSDPSLEHWKLALGIAVEHADGSKTMPPFPVLTWLWNSVKVAGSLPSELWHCPQLALTLLPECALPVKAKFCVLC